MLDKYLLMIRMIFFICFYVDGCLMIYFPLTLKGFDLESSSIGFVLAVGSFTKVFGPILSSLVYELNKLSIKCSIILFFSLSALFMSLPLAMNICLNYHSIHSKSLNNATIFTNTSSSSNQVIQQNHSMDFIYWILIISITIGSLFKVTCHSYLDMLTCNYLLQSSSNKRLSDAQTTPTSIQRSTRIVQSDNLEEFRDQTDSRDQTEFDILKKFEYGRIRMFSMIGFGSSSLITGLISYIINKSKDKQLDSVLIINFILIGTIWVCCLLIFLVVFNIQIVDRPSESSTTKDIVFLRIRQFFGSFCSNNSYILVVYYFIHLVYTISYAICISFISILMKSFNINELYIGLTSGMACFSEAIGMFCSDYISNYQRYDLVILAAILIHSIRTFLLAQYSTLPVFIIHGLLSGITYGLYRPCLIRKIVESLKLYSSYSHSLISGHHLSGLNSFGYLAWSISSISSGYILKYYNGKRTFMVSAYISLVLGLIMFFYILFKVLVSSKLFFKIKKMLLGPNRNVNYHLINQDQLSYHFKSDTNSTVSHPT